MAHFSIYSEPFTILESYVKKWPLAKEPTLERMWIYALKGTVLWKKNSTV